MAGCSFWHSLGGLGLGWVQDRGCRGGTVLGWPVANEAETPLVLQQHPNAGGLLSAPRRTTACLHLGSVAHGRLQLGRAVLHGEGRRRLEQRQAVLHPAGLRDGYGPLGFVAGAAAHPQVLPPGAAASGVAPPLPFTAVRNCEWLPSPVQSGLRCQRGSLSELLVRPRGATSSPTTTNARTWREAAVPNVRLRLGGRNQNSRVTQAI